MESNDACNMDRTYIKVGARTLTHSQKPVLISPNFTLSPNKNVLLFSYPGFGDTKLGSCMQFRALVCRVGRLSDWAVPAIVRIGQHQSWWFGRLTVKYGLAETIPLD